MDAQLRMHSIIMFTLFLIAGFVLQLCLSPLVLHSTICTIPPRHLQTKTL